MRVARRGASANSMAPVEGSQFDLAAGTGAPAPDMAASFVGAAVASAGGHVEQDPGIAWGQAGLVRPIRPLRRYAVPSMCRSHLWARRSGEIRPRLAGDLRASRFILGAVIFSGKPRQFDRGSSSQQPTVPAFGTGHPSPHLRTHLSS